MAADARPAEVDHHGNNQIGVAERKAVTVAVAAAIDALKRSTVGLGNGVGLRAGTFQTTYDGKGGQTTTLANCGFATDVTVNGTFVWGADKSFVADLTVSGAGTAGGTLHVDGTWQAPDGSLWHTWQIGPNDGWNGQIINHGKPQGTSLKPAVL